MRMQTRPYFVRAEWDEEALVWVATSDDVPGLVTEADTMESLIAKLRALIPELLEANGQAALDAVPFELLTRRFETIPAAPRDGGLRSSPATRRTGSSSRLDCPRSSEVPRHAGRGPRSGTGSGSLW